MENTSQLLQDILSELRTSRQTLGFGHPPKPRYIYANRKYPNCLWYFWNKEKDEHEPIEYQALTGIIEKLEVEQKEFRGKLENKINLHLRCDRRYIIQAGQDTLFAKGLLYTLSRLPSSALANPITIAVEPGDTEQVLFCRVYNPVTGQSAYAPYLEDTDWEKVTNIVISKIQEGHQLK